MPDPSPPFVVAAVQAAPCFLDREATLDKACERIAEAARAGARLVAFPESFVPTYPDWVWAIPPGERELLDELYATLVEQSVTVPGPATERLGRVARQCATQLVIGVSERNVEASGTSLYNSLLFFDEEGALRGCHRKLVPTGGERLVWAQGDGSTLAVYETPLGRLGGLICWENYMPLARYALYAWGIELYVAATWDRGEAWLATLRHIAREGRLFVIGCGMALRRDDIPDHYAFKQRFYAQAGEWINGGDSAIVNPEGEIVAGPLHEQEGILYAEVDPARVRGSRWMLDVAGHYARPDLFRLTVRRGARPLVEVAEEEADGERP